ncbi:MAG: acetylxylan esterase, partial [Cyclobacteriaceae bacterium]|nr:acetylxylan esterase [Cyclobacteriaceae bacterium]
FRDEKTNKKENIETSKYYDVVNFGKQITVPGFYSFGFNDNVCPPTSIYSVLNVIKAEKKISVYHDMAHWRYPEAYKEGEAWLFNNLGVME